MVWTRYFPAMMSPGWISSLRLGADLGGGGTSRKTAGARPAKASKGKVGGLAAIAGERSKRRADAKRLISRSFSAARGALGRYDGGHAIHPLGHSRRDVGV